MRSLGSPLALVFVLGCGGAAAHGATTPLTETRVHAVALGRGHACARHEDGTVSCWGDGSDGQLGDGARLSRSSPVVVSGLAGVEELAAGSGHTCARRSDGTVVCWGARARGQVGDGTASDEPALAPLAVVGLADAVQITAGSLHSCALRGDASVWCWGDDLHGQLGRGGVGGPDAMSSAPVRVEGVTDAVEVRAGGAHTCARTRGGQVYCWGDGAAGQLGELADARVVPHPVLVGGLTDALELSLGDRHSCARHGAGLVACWGDGAWGQLGDGARASRAVPVDVAGLSGVEEVDAGAEHTCARLTSLEVRCWGHGDRGQLGDGATEDRAAPAASAVTALQVAAGGATTCAIDDHGGVHCWGSGAFGQLGDGRTPWRAEPRLVQTSAGATTLRAGGDHVCARIEGAWRCWGDGAYGQLGDRTTVSRALPTPMIVAADAEDLVLGPSRTCALHGEALACWGRDASAHAVLAPAALATDAHAATIGAGFACMIGDGGSVSCWGEGTRGQLGRGTTTSDEHPVAIAGLAGAIAVAAGGTHACAVLDSGHVACWGADDVGQLGDAGSEDHAAPFELESVTDARALSAGLVHTCALHANGAVTCWGAGRDGQLGNGETTRSGRPTQIAGVTDVVEVAAGAAHTCARTRSEEVWCWGANRWGQVGPHGDREPVVRPTRVEGVRARGLAVGSTHTCALVAEGVTCWGSDAAGQLGDGDASMATRAVEVVWAASPAGTSGASDAPR